MEITPRKVKELETELAGVLVSLRMQVLYASWQKAVLLKYMSLNKPLTAFYTQKEEFTELSPFGAAVQLMPGRLFTCLNLNCQPAIWQLTWKWQPMTGRRRLRDKCCVWISWSGVLCLKRPKYPTMPSNITSDFAVLLSQSSPGRHCVWCWVNTLFSPQNCRDHCPPGNTLIQSLPSILVQIG